MTENRFYIDTIDGGESVLTDNGKELTLEEIVGIMNELHEKNQELKQEVIFWKNLVEHRKRYLND